MKRRLALILAAAVIASAIIYGVARAVTICSSGCLDDGTANPDANVATWQALTPPPCTDGSSIEGQTATWAALTATAIPWVAFPTCDLSRP